MKIFVLLSFALLPLTSAVAGPEDHRYESCYTATSTVPNEIPSIFCFDGMILNNEKTILSIWGTFSNLPDEMPVKSFIFKTEDRVKFNAEKRIVNIWESGCGNGLEVDLKIIGESDITQGEQINPKELTIKVEYNETNDTCHSTPQSSEVVYKLSR